MRIKALIISILAVIFLTLNSIAQKPEKIISFAKESRPCEWYKTQANIWKKETQKNKKNANAWSNYYRATRYSILMCNGDSVFNQNKWQIMDSITKPILSQMKKYIPNSFEYNHLMYYASGNDAENKFNYIEKAYQIDPNRPEGMSDLIAAYLLRGENEKVPPILKRWFETETPSQGLITWNYNMIAGLDSNAIIFVDGDNDFYQKEWLQQVKSIRTDIKVILVSFLSVDKFRNKTIADLKMPAFTITIQECGSYEKFTQAIIMHILKNSHNRPIYFSSAMQPSNYNFIQDSLYLEGLAYKYSSERYDNIAVIKRNFEQTYLLDYIKKPLLNDVSSGMVSQTSLCYLLPFTQLYNHYKTSGEKSKADSILDLMILITQKAENKEYFEYILELKKQK
ncbi:MAG: hypothetical protein WCP69_07850 [Bacteroidota bacterium]